MMDAQNPTSLLEVVSLVEPCAVPWNSLDAQADRKRFCQNCKKVVHDFNVLSEAEIIALLQSDPGNICGSYRDLRIPTELLQKYPRQPVKKRNSIRLAAAFASIVALIQLPKAAPLHPQTDYSFVDQSDVNPDAAPGNTLVTGVVVDQYGNLVNDNVEVVILRDGYEIVRMNAQKGLFSFDLSEKACSEDSITVQVLPWPKPQAAAVPDSTIEPVFMVSLAINSFAGTSQKVLLADAQNLSLKVDVSPPSFWFNPYTVTYQGGFGGGPFQFDWRLATSTFVIVSVEPNNPYRDCENY